MWNKRRTRQAFGVSSSNGKSNNRYLPSIHGEGGAVHKWTFSGGCYGIITLKTKPLYQLFHELRRGQDLCQRSNCKSSGNNHLPERAQRTQREQQIPRNCGSE